MVLKPDVGERGSGVRFARTPAELERAAREVATDTLLQEYAPGIELGIFYVRRPDEARGRIFSLTEKRLISVTGDGCRTLEELILDDPRAVCLAQRFLARFAARLDEVPWSGESVPPGRRGHAQPGGAVPRRGAGTGRPRSRPRSTGSRSRCPASTSAASTCASRRSTRSAPGAASACSS